MSSKPLIYQGTKFHDDLQKLIEDVFSVVWPDSPDLEAKKKDIVGMILVPKLSPRVDKELLDQFPSLKVVGNHGVGYDNVDLPACASRGVKVGNTPKVLDDATADIAFALLLSSARRVCEGDAIVRNPPASYDINWYGYQVTGATLGIVGMGNIGIKIAQRALGFRMKILYNKRRRQPESVEEALSAEYCPSLLDMLPRCDFVVLVVPGTKENQKMFSTKEFKAMKKTAIFVNVGRGSVVDQDALVLALTDKTIAAAGVDVTSPEPLPRDHPLLKIPNLTLTPHVGTATMYTRQKMVQLIIKNVLCGIQGKPLVCEV